jgi:acyl-CoA synthetase (AMP-forming)/AMP-acid ligase II
MHPGLIAKVSPDKIAYIMATSGVAVSYRELDARSNQFAHLLRGQGLKRGDAIAIYMENNVHYFPLCWGAHRAGLYYTCISSHLTAEEVDYIIGDCGARLFVTSDAKADVARDLLDLMPNVDTRLMVEGCIEGYDAYEAATAPLPVQPIADEAEGDDMLYSSGTTGRPKGIRSALKEEPFGTPPETMLALAALYQINDNTVYLSPAPLYHAAPLRYNLLVQRVGGTCIIMEKFDPEQALALFGRYQATHSQWVPTMFVRMLRLPEAVRNKYDLSTMRVAIHAAAPCPVQIKEQIIDWWGPVIYEYYAGTEGNGFCSILSDEWLSHKGSVGKALIGEIHILDDDGNEQPTGEAGTIYFAGGKEFAYHNDPEKTADSRNALGWSTLGDVGFLDEEGYLYLTDRKAYMIISGGVNIYPQETENLLVTHPKVMDVAVIGVPHEEFGEEVKAVVQPVDPAHEGPELEAELIEFCQTHLSRIKCPRSVDFDAALPRHENGKLYKRLIKDRYWGKANATIV